MSNIGSDEQPIQEGQGVIGIGQPVFQSGYHFQPDTKPAMMMPEDTSKQVADVIGDQTVILQQLRRMDVRTSNVERIVVRQNEFAPLLFFLVAVLMFLNIVIGVIILWRLD